ncbi:hypothetical protein [Flavobacterium aquicola]|uniref:DUF4468 domain-containing protein n=1 Tax=Flavobacterium aquicola TaxID=1682742 RepID=A0A3E0E093_9FLAO|nr:hypothetical protein [Flavobacterium aquicola]REG91143.1 hypothetical protein C8P67_11737 [Flavobacterium aquicola]
MKKILIILLFVFTNSFAQSSYILDKKGKTTYIRPDRTNIILIDKRISYTIVGKSWEKYIKFEDLDYAVIGSSILKSFHLNQKKKSNVYFIYGETDEKKLIGLAVTVTTTRGSFVSSKTYYELYVIDNNEMVLDEITVTSGNSKSKIEDRTKIAPMIRKHFSDCPDLIAKLDKYDDNDEKSASILSFFFDTENINCNE